MSMYIKHIVRFLVCVCFFAPLASWSMPKKGNSTSTGDDDWQILADAQRTCEKERNRQDRLKIILHEACPLIDQIIPPLGPEIHDPQEIYSRYRRALEISCSALRSFKDLFCAFHDVVEALEHIRRQSLLFRLTAQERKNEWISDNVEFLALHNRMANFYLNYLQSALTDGQEIDLHLAIYDPSDDREFLKGIVNDDDQYSAKAREFAQFLLGGVELYISRHTYKQKHKIFKEELRPAFDAAIKDYINFLIQQSKGRTGEKSSLYHQIKNDYADLVATGKRPINTIGAWVASMLKKYEEQLRQLEDERMRFQGMDHTKVSGEISKILTEAVVAKKSDNNRGKTKKQSGHKKKKSQFPLIGKNAEQSRSLRCQDGGDRVEEETPFTIYQGRFGANDPVQNIASLCQRVLSCGSRTNIEADDGRKTLVQRRIDAVRQQLRQPSSIKSYAYHTIMKWFKDPVGALEREVLVYPQSNQTEEQKNNNIVAHTFPLELDGLLEQLAYKFDAVDKPDELLYIIPGSLRTREGSELPGYYTLLVDTTDNKNVCWHRSFTKKEFKPDENWSDQKLYTRPNKSYKRQLGDDRELLDHETIQQRIVELDESSDVQRGFMKLNGKFEVRIDALSVSVADPRGNVFRFMNTKKSS